MVVGQQSLDIGNVFCYLANVWFGAVTNVTSNALYAEEKERERVNYVNLSVSVDGRYL